MTRYAFISHMEDYMKKLLTDPLHADTDDFLKSHKIDGPKAIEILTKRADPNDENSSVVIKKVAIKDNGTDENGKRLKDSFTVKYKIPRKDYTKKMRNLYISLFESNIVEGCPIIEEGAWGYGILDNDSALDYQSETAKVYLGKIMHDIETASDSDSKWAKVGVLVDFLKKYKNDELQVTDEYNEAIELAKNALSDLVSDSKFTSNWSDENKIKDSLKKAYNDVTLLKYDKNIMVPNEKPLGLKGNIMEDEGGFVADGAAACNDSAPIVPLGRKTSPTPKQEGTDVIRRKTIYLTQEQVNAIKKVLNEDSPAVCDTPAGDFGYDAPMGDGKKNSGNDFYKETNDHKDMMKKSWKGNMEESSIHIKKENEGKFTATKKRTGKSTEELTHSKNPITKKRAIFAQNAAKWNKK